MSVIPSSAVRRGRFDEEIMPLQQTKKNKTETQRALIVFQHFPTRKRDDIT